MRRWLSACLLLAFAPWALAGTSIVNVGGANLSFSPQTISIKVGDTVTFVNKGGYHNARANDGSFRCARGCDGDGKGGNGNPSSSNWIASVTFAKAGTVGYYCEIHGQPGAGMYGTINVNGPPPAVPGGETALYFLLACALALAAMFHMRRHQRT